MLPGLISAIYVIVTANKLLAQQVDRGTLAYVLSTPVSRVKVVITQGAFFLGSLFLMFGISGAAHILSHYITAGGITSSEVSTILLLNLGLFVLNAALSGICFLASCVFNLSKHVIAVGGGIVGAFLVLSIMPMFGASFHWMRNITLVTLFDINSVMAGATADFVWKYIVLAAVGAITYAAGTIIFSKRDLPL
jgi:ABC-2 type transport system permease protein